MGVAFVGLGVWFGVARQIHDGCVWGECAFDFVAPSMALALENLRALFGFVVGLVGFLAEYSLEYQPSNADIPTYGRYLARLQSVRLALGYFGYFLGGATVDWKPNSCICFPIDVIFLFDAINTLSLNVVIKLFMSSAIA